MAHESPGKSETTASGRAEAETQIMFSVRCGSNCALRKHGLRKGLTTGTRDVRNTGESAPLQPVGITWECIEACATQYDILQEERLWSDVRPDDTVAPTSGAEAVQTVRDRALYERMNSNASLNVELKSTVYAVLLISTCVSSARM